MDTLLSKVLKMILKKYIALLVIQLAYNVINPFSRVFKKELKGEL